MTASASCLGRATPLLDFGSELSTLSRKPLREDSLAVLEQPVATRRRDVEDVLREGGFTRFHRRAVVVTGVAWTFVAMEILLVAFVLQTIGQQWNLSATWLGWIGSSVLAGNLVGTVLLGRLSDRIGRRELFQASILWYAAFTALTALAWGPESFLAFRFLAGVGLGGMLVVDPSLLAEYLPPQRRGRFLVFLDFWWPVGMLVAIGLSWIFIAQLGGEWRWLFLVASFPALLAFVARRSLPESPYYLARKGRNEEAADVLEEVTGTRVEAAALGARAEPRSSFLDLFRRTLARDTVLIAVAWITLNISYYGLFIWLPGVLAIRELGVDPYLLLTLTALAQFPGYGAALWLVEAWGRKRTLAAFLALGGVSALTFAFADSTPVYVASLFFVGFFNLGAWGAVYAYTPELFPTRLRSTAFGFAEGVGKAAAISGPYVFAFLLAATGTTVWSLVFVAAVMATGALVVAFGRETRGRPLV